MKRANRISSRRCLTNANLLRFLAFLVVSLCLTVGPVLAGDKGETKKETKKEAKFEQKKKSESEEKTLITGSLIPQQAKPNRIPPRSLIKGHGQWEPPLTNARRAAQNFFATSK